MPIENGKRIEIGGRAKGTPNKATAARQKRIAESGLTPLDYLLRIMRDESLDHHQRIDAAKAAAPYVHPRLASIEHKGDAENPLNVRFAFRWMTEQEARCRGWA